MRRLTPLLIAGTAAILAVAESRRPLRRRVADRRTRAVRNLALGAVSALVSAALQKGVVAPLQRRRTGILHQLDHRIDLPPLVRRAVAILLLDYTLWWWHRANHQVPLLWRFHALHHEDRDLDVTTALRFHVGEMALAAFFRAAQVGVIGANEDDVAAWQRLLLPSILFHHSNVRLPERLDTLLARCILVTPRMHGIHHADQPELANSNWSSLFPWWDALHGTLRLDVAQEEIRIGLPHFISKSSNSKPGATKQATSE
jgi:sterol desaturase/sphingolipid hydroxylase (fatty acid hydroxylase superfamily)